MRWPWSRPIEQRDSGGDFSDAVVRLIESQAAGTAADASSTAAVEAASGALSRAFAAATVEAEGYAKAAITPVVLGQIGRDLVRSGDSLHVIQIIAGKAKLIPMLILALGRQPRSRLLDREGIRLRSQHVHHVEPPRGWCRLRHVGQHTRPALRRSRTDVVGAYHRPPPIRSREGASRRIGRCDRQPGTDARRPGPDQPGPVPITQSGHRSRQGKSPLRGEHLVGRARRQILRPSVGLETEPAGTQPHPSTGTDRPAILRADPGRLWDPSLFIDSDGTSQREGVRRWHLGTVIPLADLVAHELTAKLETPVRLRFDNYPMDLAGRAQAFGKLVSGGMELERALAISGLLADD